MSLFVLRREMEIVCICIAVWSASLFWDHLALLYYFHLSLNYHFRACSIFKIIHLKKITKCTYNEKQGNNPQGMRGFLCNTRDHKASSSGFDSNSYSAQQHLVPKKIYLHKQQTGNITRSTHLVQEKQNKKDTTPAHNFSLQAQHKLPAVNFLFYFLRLCCCSCSLEHVL